jgi:hypothetical protein
MYIYIYISYININVYTLANFLTKSKKRKKQTVTQTCRSQVTVSGQGFRNTQVRSRSQVTGFQKNRRSGPVSGQGVPET